MSTQQLEYGQRPALLTRKRTRWIIAAVIVLALGIAALLNRRTIDVYARQARLLLNQRQWLQHSAPPDHVVYDDDPTRAAALLARAEYHERKLPNYPSVVVWDSHLFPWIWVHANPTSPPTRPGLLFMHERYTPAGEWFILACTVDVTYTVGGQCRPRFELHEFRPATWSTRVVRRNSLRTSLPELDSAVGAGKHLRLYAGQVDPNDRTHFTVRYEIDGVEGVIDGYEGDRIEDANGVPRPGLRLELRKPKGPG